MPRHQNALHGALNGVQISVPVIEKIRTIRAAAAYVIAFVHLRKPVMCVVRFAQMGFGIIADQAISIPMTQAAIMMMILLAVIV